VAGLAAARHLHDCGHEALILEARSRIGGRAHTDYTLADFPVELGAEFIHGKRAVTHDLVRQAGLSVIPVVRLGNLWWAEKGNRAIPRALWPPDLQTALDALLADYHRLPEADLPADASLADYLRGRGWEGERLAIADVLLAQTCCAADHSLNCYDLIREMRADHAGKDEARIREGYARLLEWYSRPLRICYNTPVTEVRWEQAGVTVVAGEQAFRARSCVVAVPVSVLQTGAIRFDPPLPEDKLRAIAAFRVEPATKLIFRFREPLWPDDLTLMAHAGTVGRWWTPGYGRSGAAILTAFVTAARARTVDALDEAGALALALRELSDLLGLPVETLREDCLAARRVSWAADPALGRYAHVPPAQQRG
jgi:monoamine oxidase